MKKFLSISVYKNPLGDSTNNGLSSKVENSILLEHPNGNITEEDFLTHPNYWGGDYLVLEDGPYNTIRLVPSKIKESKKLPMSGGNFGYTTDSRFRRISNQPIHIFDRVE